MPAIGEHHTATSDKSWDAGANEKRLKEDQKASYYRKEYAWVDPDKDATKKAAYKFPHHEVSSDGTIGAANVAGCHSIISVLNGGRGGAKIPDADRQGVYNHAKAHLEDAGEKEIAPLKKSEENRVRTRLQPGFRAALKDDSVLEMCIYEEIGADYFGSGVTADSVKQELDQAGTGYSRIALRINSPGGDAFEGVAIRSLLRAQNKPVDVYIDGIAASAASIIAMAGDTITMAKGSMMMIHDAWSVCIGKDEDMRKMADTLEKVSDSIASVYADRTGKPLEEVAALMDAESWMGADECLAAGFCTAVTTHEDQQALALAAGFKLLGKLKSVPEQLKAAATNKEEEHEEDDACQCDCESCMDGDCSDCSNAACADENCEDCPVQNESAEASNLSQYEARLKLLRVA